MITMPSAKVRFAGPTHSRGARWIVTLPAPPGKDKPVRVQVPFRYELPSSGNHAYFAVVDACKKRPDVPYFPDPRSIVLRHPSRDEYFVLLKERFE